MPINRSPDTTAATQQRKLNAKSVANSYANYTTAETPNGSMMKSSRQSVKDYKKTPHYSAPQLEEDELVWDRDVLNLEHFKDLKQYE